MVVLREFCYGLMAVADRINDKQAFDSA